MIASHNQVFTVPTPSSTEGACLHAGRLYVWELHSMPAEVCTAKECGMHAQASIEAAVALLHARGMDPGSAGVYFGQLLGMADNLSFVLGANGYRVRTPLCSCSPPLPCCPAEASTPEEVSFTHLVHCLQLLSICMHACTSGTSCRQVHGRTAPVHMQLT